MNICKLVARIARVNARSACNSMQILWLASSQTISWSFGARRIDTQCHQQSRPHRRCDLCFGSTAAKIASFSTQQACSRCCYFITRSWHCAACSQQSLHHRWIGSKPKQYLHPSRGMSAPQPGRNLCLPQGTAAGLWGHVAAIWGTSGTVDVPLPTDKLSASMPHDIDHHPVVLVNCGSFNPPTIMHLRMFDVAAQVLEKVTATFLLHNSPMHICTLACICTALLLVGCSICICADLRL